MLATITSFFALRLDLVVKIPTIIESAGGTLRFSPIAVIKCLCATHNYAVVDVLKR
jgi:hypothetical protein